jgi:hypothetical protein
MSEEGISSLFQANSIAPATYPKAVVASYVPAIAYEGCSLVSHSFKIAYWKKLFYSVPTER